MSELYEILDPRPIAASAPYTFFLPDAEAIEAVAVGDHVKAIVRAIPPSEECDAERMWIRITTADTEWLEGVLDSRPLDMPRLSLGSIIRLPRSHVIDLDIVDPVKSALSTIRPKRHYWARCLVDQAILDGELAVEYLYRETPDMTKDGDRFPDSGWRIRGDTRGNLISQLGNRKVAYVALGAVLNVDDSWLHLIDEPNGSRFEKDYEKDVFVTEK